MPKDTEFLEGMGCFDKLMNCNDCEILLEGPAGVGKTRCLLEKIHRLAEEYPHSRYLICRKARSDMAESILVTWERGVMPVDHEAMKWKGTRIHRYSYQYSNGSKVVVGGLDNISKMFSSRYDIIAVFEAIECSESDWEFLCCRLRNNALPFQQIIADTNPGAENHWLNQRAAAGKMTRLKIGFNDNPRITTAYLKKLKKMTGVRRKHLYEGKWV